MITAFIAAISGFMTIGGLVGESVAVAIGASAATGTAIGTVAGAGVGAVAGIALQENETKDIV